MTWMLDTGLVDDHNWIGFEAEPGLYAQLQQLGRFMSLRTCKRRDASGNTHVAPAGLVHARLLHPTSKIGVGPLVSIFVMEGVRGVPSRVGTSFFHRLQGCNIHWDFDNRIWSINYP